MEYSAGNFFVDLGFSSKWLLIVLSKGFGRLSSDVVVLEEPVLILFGLRDQRDVYGRGKRREVGGFFVVVWFLFNILY